MQFNPTWITKVEENEYVLKCSNNVLLSVRLLTFQKLYIF